MLTKRSFARASFADAGSRVGGSWQDRMQRTKQRDPYLFGSTTLRSHRVSFCSCRFTLLHAEVLVPVPYLCAPVLFSIVEAPVCLTRTSCKHALVDKNIIRIRTLLATRYRANTRYQTAPVATCDLRNARPRTRSRRPVQYPAVTLMQHWQLGRRCTVATTTRRG